MVGPVAAVEADQLRHSKWNIHCVTNPIMHGLVGCLKNKKVSKQTTMQIMYKEIRHSGYFIQCK